MATIFVGAVWSTLSATPAERRCVYDALSASDPGAQHTTIFKRGHWDGVAHLMRRADDQFPAGLTRRAARALVAAGHPRPEITWPDVDDRPPLSDTLDVELRDYQAAAVERAIRARRTLIQCPTATGKTEIGLEIARRLGRRTLWLTARRALADQTSARAAKRLGAGAEDVVVAMVPTLASRIGDAGVSEFLAQFEVVIFDEAHHAGAPTWQAVAAACVNAHFRVGLSATPSTGNAVTDMRIEGAIGPTVRAATASAMAARGYLAAPRVVMLRPPLTSYPSYEEIRDDVFPAWRDDSRALMKLSGALFRRMYDLAVVENKARNKMIVEAVERHRDERVLVLCSRVGHARSLGISINGRRGDAGRPVFVLEGGSTESARDDALAAFSAAGSGAVLVATPFFREGMDVPQIDVGVIAGGGLSDIAVIQGLGRMLRPRPDKDEVRVYDFQDGGRGRADKDWCQIHSDSRVALYREQGFTVDA